MNALGTPNLAVFSEHRERIYRVLLAESGRDWRVSQLAEQVPQVSVEAVRTTLFLLLGDRLVEVVPHQRSLTFRLSDKGRAMLGQITAGWQRPHGSGGGL